MSFDEVQFPIDISYGSRGGPSFATLVTVTDSGVEQRVSKRSTPVYKFDVSYGIKTYAQLRSVRDFFMARRGAAQGFRYKDQLDFTSAADGISAAANTDQVLGLGDATKVAFQLIKTYGTAPYTTQRVISKPVAGTVTIALNGVNTALFTVNTVSGIVTMNSAPGMGVQVTAGFQFDNPVRFGDEADKGLLTAQDSFGDGSMPNIPLVELVNPVQTAGQFFYGGADIKAFTGNISLSAADARVQSLTPNAAALSCTLPPLADIPFGGPAFYLINESVANTLALKKQETGAVLDTMPIGVVCWELLVKKDGTGAKVWEFKK